MTPRIFVKFFFHDMASVYIHSPPFHVHLSEASVLFIYFFFFNVDRCLFLLLLCGGCVFLGFAAG